MRKHDEGYTLVLVMVVILALSVVSAGLMSMSLGNLKAQRNFANQMVEKYAAQGELEKQVAILESLLTEGETKVIAVEKSPVIETDYPLTAVTAWISEKFGEIADVDTFTIQVVEDEKDFTCVIPLEVISESEKTRIQCELILRGNVEEVEPEPTESTEPTEPGESTDPTEEPKEFFFKVTFRDMSYQTYTISNNNEGGGGE